jgi:hypothetical protein
MDDKAKENESFWKYINAAVKRLVDKNIDIAQFEETCNAECVRHYGQPPDGQRYIIGIVDNSIVVGHVACNGAEADAGMKFPWSCGKLVEARPAEMDSANEIKIKLPFKMECKDD